MEQMSMAQKKVFDAVVELSEELSYSPTFREIAERAGLKSQSTVYGHMKKLEEKGFVEWDKSKPRILKIVDTI
ncbi:helix-turn-helix domain-containing protein [Bacillus solimangrovi]|uniref:LexA repressor DNA-binding domain-containing protein n=1 Tax=Bacillus solimangrovi TaxID=1305675 RepID=A0A1E5LIQ3_9BACI|nr:helix-turn-helix domain-containing protein [Bacillus solimangrovi]OEH93957.1 hypothetical protein BFG57_09935 [Bacillus solimangrovi]